MKQRYIRSFGSRYECNSPNQKTLLKIFHDQCRLQGVMDEVDAIFTYMNEFEEKKIEKQLSFF